MSFAAMKILTKKNRACCTEYVLQALPVLSLLFHLRRMFSNLPDFVDARLQATAQCVQILR